MAFRAPNIIITVYDEYDDRGCYTGEVTIGDIVIFTYTGRAADAEAHADETRDEFARRLRAALI